MTIVTNGFSPYRVPLWNALGKLCDLSLVLLALKGRNRSWNVDFSSVQCPVSSVDSFRIFVGSLDWELNLSYGKVKRAVERTRPDAILVSGYDCPGYWAVLAWARQRRVPVIIFMESTALSSRTKGVRLFDTFRRRFANSCQAFYAGSRLSATYLVDLGVPPERIVIGNSTCDTNRFTRCERIGDLAVPSLLYVGQLIRRKGILQLLEALAEITDRPWRLRIAGDGALQSKLSGMTERLGIAKRVEVAGYVQQSSLSEVYRGSDILIFPSLNEPYGLVVSEALLSGVYVVGSNRSAASLELIQPGVNGEIVSPQDTDDLAQGMRRALTGVPYDRWAIRRTVEHITPELEAVKLMRAVQIAMGDSA